MSNRNTQRMPAGRAKSRSSQRGQVLVMATLGLTFIMGVLGWAVDLGWMHFIQQSEQAAADAGVMAAVYQAKVNDTSAAANYCSSVAAGTCTTVFTNCTAILATDSLNSACTYAKTNMNTGVGTYTLTAMEGINGPPPSGGAGAAYWAEVLVTENVPRWFSVLTTHSLKGFVAAYAAASIAAASPACVTILDPNPGTVPFDGQGALYATGTGADLTASCGIAVKSTYSAAISVNGLASITGGGISDCGGESVNTGTIAPGAGKPNNDNGSNGGTNNPCPGGVTDPNGGLPLPVVNGVLVSAAANTGPTCGTFPSGQAAQTTFDSNTDYLTGQNGCNGSGPNFCSSTTHPIVLNPGVYCGGLTIQGATVVFNPGVYIMNGGSSATGGNTLVIQNSSTVTNNTAGGDGSGGVTFFLTAYGSQAGDYEPALMGDSNVVDVTLNAPTGGEYAGVLIYQDPGITPASSYPGTGSNSATDTVPAGTKPSTIDAHGNFTLSGQIYLPTTGLILTGQPTELGVTGLDVYALELDGSAGLTMAAAANGGNATPGAVALVN